MGHLSLNMIYHKHLNLYFKIFEQISKKENIWNKSLNKKIFETNNVSQPPSQARDGDGDIQNADVYLDHKFLHFFPSQRILKEADKNMHENPFEFSILCDGGKKFGATTFQS